EERKGGGVALGGAFLAEAGGDRFGCRQNNLIRFPQGTGSRGRVQPGGQRCRLRLAPGVQATVAGRPITGGQMEPDTSKNVTIVEMGSLRFHLIVRGERVGIRLKDLESEAVRNYRGPDFFPLNMNYRVIAKWGPAEGNRTVDVPNVLGDVKPRRVSGRAVIKR